MRGFIKILGLLIIVYSQITFSQAYTWYLIPTGFTTQLNWTNGYLAIGSNGTIISSSNGGLSWYQQNSGTNVNLNFCISDQNGRWVVGNSGKILFQSYNSNNWQNYPSGVNNDLKSIVYSWDNNIGRLLIVGGGGLILRSTNNGVNWNVINSGTSQDLNGIFAEYNGGYTIWVVGNNGVILRSNDYGLSWSQVSASTSLKLNSVSCSSYPIKLWIAGNNGLILRSTNEGQNWNQINTNVINNLNSITPLNTNLANDGFYCVGDGGLILKSTNNGVTIFQEVSSTLNNLHYIFGDYTNAWVCGNVGTVLNNTIPSIQFRYKEINANQIDTWITNRGEVNTHHYSGSNSDGFIWPKGTTKNAIFASGIWLGGKVSNDLRVAIYFDAGYESEFYPGYVDYPTQSPHGKSDTLYKIYKVSPIYPNGGNGFDPWSVWPVNQGAKWVDNNHNGTYDPPIDNPVMKGDQNLFCAYTDGYPESHFNYAGSTLPLKADLHLYSFAANNPLCADAMYMEWDIINKNNVAWDSFYVALWSDPDLGGADDITGCDTSLNLGFNYKWRDTDNVYGAHPPAFGYALYKASKHTGRLIDVFNDPEKDVYEPQSAIETYRLLCGRKTDNTQWINPITHQPSRLLYSGNPVDSTGWLFINRFGEHYPDDTRMLIGSYFGTVQPLDTIKFYVVAFIKRGSNYLNSVSQLKNCINNGVIGNSQNYSNIPKEFKLFQNFPNPFNPVTKIKIQNPVNGNVKITVYDVLGRKVKVLINEYKKAGEYETEFNGENFASGVYFYKLEINGMSQIRKMVLLK